MTSEVVRPGGTIGILGGGQLGRMLAIAAAELGLKCHVFAPPGDNPAFEVAGWATEAAFEDEAALGRFASAVDVVTYEFENVPLATAATVVRSTPLYPPPRALEVSQDRAVEKTFLGRLGIGTAPWIQGAELAQSCGARFPGIVKTRRYGYDGKGQVRVASEADLRSALSEFRATDVIYEELVPFAREVSVIAARARDGSIAAYEVGENVHSGGILRTTTVPARIRPETADEARRITGLILDALGYVGVIGVEFFVVESGGREALLVNEFAPRVHNSGHWTIDGCCVSQFEQHARAVAGWPLGNATRHSDARMVNLIGAEVEDWPKWAAKPAVAVHLYGKAETKPGRKMGHVTELMPLGDLENTGV